METEMSRSALAGTFRGGDFGALQLDEAERSHLFDLVRSRPRPSQERVQPVVQRIHDSMTAPPRCRDCYPRLRGVGTSGRRGVADPRLQRRTEKSLSARVGSVGQLDDDILG